MEAITTMPSIAAVFWGERGGLSQTLGSGPDRLIATVIVCEGAEVWFVTGVHSQHAHHSNANLVPSVCILV